MPDGGLITGALLAGASVHSANQAADASLRSAALQGGANKRAIKNLKRQSRRARRELSVLDPLVDQGLEASEFLANPDAQFDFLQSNPLFQMALDEANAGTTAMAAAQGRLGAGDTRSELARNVFLSGLPLLDRQRQDVTNLLNVGTDVVTSRANARQNLGAQISPLISGIGAAQAGGVIGANNAQQQGLQNLFGLFGQFAGGGAFGKDLQGIFG